MLSQNRVAIAEKKNQFYVKTIINQINVGYSRSIIPSISLSVEAGYQFSYLSEWHYKGTVIPLELVYKNLAYSGYSFRFSPNFHVDKNWSISPLVGYQNLYANKIIYDPGNFGGVSNAVYDEYSQRIHEIITQILFYQQIPDIPMQFYFGLGMRFQHLYNDYSIEGTVDYKKPSDRNEDYSITYFPSIIIGLKITFVWF